MLNNFLQHRSQYINDAVNAINNRKELIGSNGETDAFLTLYSLITLSKKYPVDGLFYRKYDCVKYARIRLFSRIFPYGNIRVRENSHSGIFDAVYCI